MPPNVFLLGTMNTADRSIKLLDAALRRRFAFLECMPDTELLHGTAVGELALDDFLDGLNQRIARFEGREKQVGHSYLLVDGQPVEEVEEFAARFREEILRCSRSTATTNMRRWRSSSALSLSMPMLAPWTQRESTMPSNW